MAQDQALIIGLGTFGMTLARTLVDRGVQVVGVDVNEARADEGAKHLTEVACFDATDETKLAELAPQSRDVTVVGIGEAAREASILCTALLSELEAKRIIARATDDLHAKILRRVGAKRVVQPERDFGQRFANQILHEAIYDEMPLGEDIVLTEFQAPKSFVGCSLDELNLRQQHKVAVVAIRHSADGALVWPEAPTRIAEEDILVAVSTRDGVSQLLAKHT